MCMDVMLSGGESTRGRKAGETSSVQMETNRSKCFFQRTIVPPCVLDLSRGRAGSIESSEWSVAKYSPLISSRASSLSHWNSIGSLSKTRSGEKDSRSCFKENLERKYPSMFQVRQEKVDLELEGASSGELELSAITSLKKGCQFQAQRIQTQNFSGQKKCQGLPRG